MDEKSVATAVDVEENAATTAADQGGDATVEPAARKPRKKRWIVLGAVVAVLVVAGAGFWVWHEQPSFCNAICHTPMDPHLATYEGQSGQPGVDKWGNTVEDAGVMLAVSHKELDDATCLSCHVPTIQEQIDEGLHWVGGNYLYPLEERTLTTLNKYRQLENPEEFCLNDACHHVNDAGEALLAREDLARETADMGERNPHVVEANHQILECSDCHKAHRAPVMACSRCHDDAEIPEGWLSAEEAAQLSAEVAA